ncbi:DNA methylase family protein [Geobacillus kaustophilus]|uniref:DNA methylase family protein n=1 Tax=Geobacillus kaustophilus TaxID=1462 RepID=A0A0D8BTS7_GEOKU|nr:site-specific DNA-methyltransferase [Geobacillus kaustophilus]KJE27608.1 DNA methylase family protein [Geobacillus kaustophilus]
MANVGGRRKQVADARLEAVKKLFPEAVVDGDIDWDRLRKELGCGGREESYEFTWPGKTEAKRLAETPPRGVLRLDRAASKWWETTTNWYIEGDNLEVLKLLGSSHEGKVQMIYIDPPYNTGKVLMYKDHWRQKKNASVRGQEAEEAHAHAGWLNMMYPRLWVARTLLAETGAIFISIDDTEQANLKKMCDEIFGERNFVATFIWQRAFSPVNMNKFASRNHDFILCYAKNIDRLAWYGLQRHPEADGRYANPDNDPRGPWTSGDLSVGPPIPEKIYDIVTPGGRVVSPPNGYCWRVTKERFAELMADNRIWFGKDGNGVPRLKRFLSEVKPTVTPLTIWTHDEVSHSQEAKKELKELFDGLAVMDYPKPVKLIQRMVALTTRDDDLILDFFSGSATTAHAVMQQNAEDGGRRSFMMVQLPERLAKTSAAYRAGFRTICDIGRERIRRSGEKIVRETGKTELDIGFKVFRLELKTKGPVR